MKPGSKGSGRSAEEAAFWVVALTEHPDRKTRARFETWARRSPTHWSEFLVAAAIYKAYQGFDRQGRFAVEDLLADAAATVVPLKRCTRAHRGADIDKQTFARTVRSRSANRWSRMTRSLLRCAAVVLLMTIALPLIGQCMQVTTLHEYVTGVGERRVIALEGSVIYLDEHSFLRVARTPNAHTLELRQGDAFFRVHRDPDHRLWILVDGTAVEDVDAAFNVRRTAAESTVSVFEGQVQVAANRHDSMPEPSILVAEAGQEIRMRATDLHVHRPPLAKLQERGAWTRGWLMIDGHSPTEVARSADRPSHRPPSVAAPSIEHLSGKAGQLLAWDFEP